MNLATTLEMIETNFARLGRQAAAGQERMINAEADRMTAEPWRIAEIAGLAASWPPSCTMTALQNTLRAAVEVGRLLGRAGHGAYSYDRHVRHVAALRALERLLAA